MFINLLFRSLLSFWGSQRQAHTSSSGDMLALMLAVICHIRNDCLVDILHDNLTSVLGGISFSTIQLTRRSMNRSSDVRNREV